jgi:hypothetical protein
MSKQGRKKSETLEELEAKIEAIVAQAEREEEARRHLGRLVAVRDNAVLGVRRMAERLEKNPSDYEAASRIYEWMAEYVRVQLEIEPTFGEKHDSDIEKQDPGPNLPAK